MPLSAFFCSLIIFSKLLYAPLCVRCTLQEKKADRAAPIKKGAKSRF